MLRIDFVATLLPRCNCRFVVVASGLDRGDSYAPPFGDMFFDHGAQKSLSILPTAKCKWENVGTLYVEVEFST